MNNPVFQKQQYMTFYLNRELYAISVNHVIEVIVGQNITNVPLSPVHVKGIINFRGTIVGIVDTRKKLLINESFDNQDYNIIIFDFNEDNQDIRLGAIVDKVSDVIDISDFDIKPIPKAGCNYNPDYIRGTYLHGNEFVHVLNIVKVFSEKSL